MKMSKLSDLQKRHFAWRLERYAGVGYITAGRIIRGEFGDGEIDEVFRRAGMRNHQSKWHSRKVVNFGA